MRRTEFHKLFKTVGPAILPVIHVLTAEQALHNARLAIRHGVQGVFLINHDFPHGELLPILADVRAALPNLWMGVNFLGVTGRDAFPVLGELSRQGTIIDAYWADNARIDEHSERQEEAEEISEARTTSGWKGLYFGGTAFKKQREVAADDYARSALLAVSHMDVVTTSGAATGIAADIDKIKQFVDGCAGHALAVASGVTPENILEFAPHLDAILIATGINRDGDFYNIDEKRLHKLMEAVRVFAAETGKSAGTA